MIMQSRASLVEDALARVLWRAYTDARIADEERDDDNPTCYDKVCDDEVTLREALFGPNPLN